MKIWNWLNGKKTYIGAGFFLAACIITDVLVGFWHVSGDWIEPTVKTLNWIGAAFTSTGFIHKFFKTTP